MELLKALAVIFGFTFFGEFVSLSFNLPIPGSIIGLTSLFIALVLKVVKVEQIKSAGEQLQKNMAFLFVPLLVGLSLQFQIMKAHLIPLTIIIIVSTILTYIIVGYVSEKVCDNE